MSIKTNQYPLIKAFIKGWKHLVGRTDEFQLEGRVFHSLILFSAVIAVFNLTVYLLLGAYSVALTFAVNILYYAVLLYFSRFKHLTKWCVIVDAVLLNVLLAFSYFENDGIGGPTILMYSAAFIGLCTYVPYRSAFALLSINVLMVFGVQCAELKFPQWIDHSYVTALQRHTDMFYVYISSSVLIFLAIYVLRTNYHRENRLAIDEADHLAVANAEKSKLFSIIAHDLRSPLAQINHYLQLLGRVEIDDPTRYSIETQLSEITNNTGLMLTNLLSWSRNQMEGSMTVNLTPVNVLQVIDQVTQTIQYAAATKNIDINVAVSDDVNVMADADHLQIIARNLLQNAVKFTHQHGKVSVGCSRERDDVIIHIQDNGIGMNVEQQKNAFHSSIKASYGTNMEKGVGLGLTLSYEFVQALDGELWFESAVNEGTTFYIRLRSA